MRTLALIFDGLFRFFQRLIFTPFLLGWLVVWLFMGVMIGTLLATPMVFAVFDQEPGESAWQWLVFGPFMLAGALFAIRDWLDRSGAATFFGGFGRDSEAADGLVARAANRFAGKADREAASVLSNAQRHTHFLDSPWIGRVMARSDFAFADLRHEVTSVFLVLPPNRLDAYSRWLRLLVSQALQDIARDAEASAVPSKPQRGPLSVPTPLDAGTVPSHVSRASVVAPPATGVPTLPGATLGLLSAAQEPQEPSKGASGSLRAVLGPRGRLKASNPMLGPALFLLDEFAALGRLEAVERAMGLMAGYGLQLWPILQLPAHLQFLRVQGEPTAMVEKLRYDADREFDGLYTEQPA